MNFFHRPKSPTKIARPPNQSEPHHASHRTRPKLTARLSSEAAIRSVLDDARHKYKEGQPSTLYEHEAVKPFDYLSVGDQQLYLGSRKPLRMAETIHSRLMSDMKVELPVQFNGDLCHIFEDYRRLLWENARMTTKEQAESDVIENMQKTHTHEKRQWRDDEADFQREIKRLETIIAYSNHGVEGVIKARQNSVIRRKKGTSKNDGMETVEEVSTQELAKSPSKFSNSSRRDDLAPGESLEPRKQHQESNTRLLPPAAAPSATISDPKDSLKLLDLTSSRGFASAASATQDHSPDKGNSDRPLHLLEQQHVFNPVSDKRRVWHGQGSDLGLKRTSSAISSGNAWSNFMPWPARKHQRKPCTSKPASSSIQGTAGSPVGQHAETAPAHVEAVSTQTELRRQRPESFYQGDELDFERRTSLYRRQRSSSLSGIPPLEQAMAIRPAADVGGDHMRPMSLDVKRPEHPPTTKEKLLSNSDDVSVGISNRDSGVSSILHRPRSNGVSDTLSHESSKQLTGSWRKEDVGPSRETNEAGVLPAAPSRRGTVIKRGKAGPESGRRSSPAAAAAAKAVSTLSSKPAKENAKVKALNKDGDKNRKRK